MPSPVGHVVAGLTVAWAAEAVAPLRRPPAATTPLLTPLALACVVLALAPDLDILLATHRTFTHSLGAVAAAAVAGGAIARARGGRGLASGLACGLAVASHVVLDWLGRDSSSPRGLLALWPVSAAYFYSGIDLFAEVSRRYWKPDEFIFKNASSVAREAMILCPIAVGVFWLRHRRLSGRGTTPTGCGGTVGQPGPESRVPSGDMPTGA